MLSKGSGSVMFAAGVGAFTGVVIANEITKDSPFWKLRILSWVVGALICAAVAWIAQNPRTVFRGMAKAYREVEGWRSSPELWTVVKALLPIFFLAGSAASSLFLCMYFFADIRICRELSWLAFLFFLLIGNIVSSAVSSRDVLRAGVILSPLVVPFASFYFAIKSLIWCMLQVPPFLRWANRFVRKTFFYIHSAKRRIAVTGALLGFALAVILHQNGIFGGVAGALAALIEFELVAIRWLKLKPARAIPQ